MRAGIEVAITPEDRRRLEAIARNRNTAQSMWPGLKSRSWLNAVEAFFAALTKWRLKRGVFRSIVDLQAAISRYIAEHNIEPKPFVWTADPDRILDAINRGKQALE